MKRISLLILQLFLVGSLFSQITSYKFKHLTVQEGLSRSWVKCVFQDRLGYLWIGTADGLNKYDGISIKTYKFSLSDSTSLNHNNITAIFEDSKGNLWIGTQAGLNKYNRHKDCFLRITSIADYVSGFCEIQNGQLYVGSPGGLFVFYPSSGKAIYVKKDSRCQIESIIKDENNTIWIGTLNGLFQLDTVTYELHKIKLTSGTDPLIRSLFIDSKKQLWIGTKSNGVYVIHNMLDKPVAYQVLNYSNDINNPGSIRKGYVYAIAQDENMNLWVGVENGGVNILPLNNYNKEKPNFLHLEHSPFDNSTITNNSIHTLYHDNNNTMWVGTYGNGLSYTNKLMQKFNHYKQIPGSLACISNNNVNAIYDDDKFTYLGTEEGLNIYDKTKKAYYTYTHDDRIPESINSNVIWSITRDSKNNLWVGTWGGGLNLFDERSHKVTKYLNDKNNPQSLGGNNITKILECKNGELWISTMGGGLNLYNYQTRSFTQYKYRRSKNSISSDWINDLAEDKYGNLWIASTLAVDVFDRKTNTFKKYVNSTSNSHSISYNGATVLFRDSKNHIWIGTSNGLNVYDDSRGIFRCYTQDDGLANNDIKAISEDDHLNLWISTSKGIFKFIAGANVPDKPQFKNYNISDGLQENEFNGRSTFKNKQGLILFGGQNGYNVFHPDSIKDNPYIPEIVFTNFLVFNKPVKPDDGSGILQNDISLTKKLKLTKDHSVFTIEFAALNLIAPEKNEYVFYLEGFEKTWNNVGKQHSVTYTNLDPGDYTFRVKASNSDGLWKEKALELRITVLPPWWQTWYAKVLYLLIIVSAIYYFRKHTIISTQLKNQLWLDHHEKKQSEELNQLKLQFFTNISHELRTPLTLIIGPLKQIIHSGSNSNKLKTVYSNASRLKILVDQILDFSKIENQMMKTQMIEKDVVEVVETCISNFVDMAVQKDISLVFKSSVSVCVSSIDEDKLDKIITNIISNAVKNTPSGGAIQTTLDIENNNEKVKITISDNGQGIPPEEIEHIFDRFFTSSKDSLVRSGTGIGLNLTHKLIEMLKGSINVESSQGKGTRFTILLPMAISKIKFEKIIKNLSIAPEKNHVSKPLQNTDTLFENTVLIIDDNEEMCNYIESTLINEYNIVKENNPIEALNLLAQNMPDLIISDVMMPEMDGFILCAKIKNDLRFCHIPIILLTAKVTVNDQITGYEKGADDYIYKPFDSDLLIARVKNLIIKKENIRRHFIGNDGVINSKAEVNSLDFSFIENIMQLIQKNYTNNDFNVNYIIEKLAISRSVFYSKFKALSNQSVNDLINNYRLKKSEELLRNSKLSVSDIALECGFTDPAYFSRVFKLKYKISPKDFKELLS